MFSLCLYSFILHSLVVIYCCYRYWMRIVYLVALAFFMLLFSFQYDESHPQTEFIVISYRGRKRIRPPSTSSPVHRNREALTVSTINADERKSNASEMIATPAFPVNDVDRQKRLNALLQTLYTRQLNINNSDTIVIYQVRKNCGFGNMIRGYFTSMLLALFYDAAFKGFPSCQD